MHAEPIIPPRPTATGTRVEFSNSETRDLDQEFLQLFGPRGLVTGRTNLDFPVLRRLQHALDITGDGEHTCDL